LISNQHGKTFVVLIETVLVGAVKTTTFAFPKIYHPENISIKFFAESPNPGKNIKVSVCFPDYGVMYKCSFLYSTLSFILFYGLKYYFNSIPFFIYSFSLIL